MLGILDRSSKAVKDNTSNDFVPYKPYISDMPVWGREQEFNEAFIARVKRLREERDWTAEQMAIALGIPAERYRKYEYRTALPHYLIEQFAQIVGRDIIYVLTGKNERPARALRTGTND